MADESKVEPGAADAPKGAPRPKARAKAAPLAPGDFVTRAGGHPDKGDGPEPVGRVVAEVEEARIVLDDKGDPKVDKDGAAVSEPDGTRLVVTWPTLRTESRHRADELERHAVKADDAE